MISGTVGRPLQHNLELLSDFGDTAVLLPLSLVFFIWLLATHRAATIRNSHRPAEMSGDARLTF
jgi:hypothetical protein